MNEAHLRKAIALIAKGLMEKDRLLKESPTQYPHSPQLQHGINMFLAASLELGNVDESILAYAHESAFLAHFIQEPIADWFKSWDTDVCESLHLTEQPFYGYGAFAYCLSSDKYVPSEDCTEFLETQEANVIEGTDEHMLFELIRQLSQEEYVQMRQYIIEHPILSDAEYHSAVLLFAKNEHSLKALKCAYERFFEKAYQCPTCGWTMTMGKHGPVCHSAYCTTRQPSLDQALVIDGTSSTVHRLKKGIMRYFVQPGKLELDIANFCKSKGLATQLWPHMDLYDIEICFPDNEIWAIDAKAYHNPVSLRNWIQSRGGFPAGEYQQAYYVIPTEFKKGDSQYTTIVNQALRKQPQVECITLRTLKSRINRKVAACDETN